MLSNLPVRGGANSPPPNVQRKSASGANEPGTGWRSLEQRRPGTKGPHCRFHRSSRGSERWLWHVVTNGFSAWPTDFNSKPCTYLCTNSWRDLGCPRFLLLAYFLFAASILPFVHYHSLPITSLKLHWHMLILITIQLGSKSFSWAQSSKLKHLSQHVTAFTANRLTYQHIGSFSSCCGCSLSDASLRVHVRPISSSCLGCILRTRHRDSTALRYQGLNRLDLSPWCWKAASHRPCISPPTSWSSSSTTSAIFCRAPGYATRCGSSNSFRIEMWPFKMLNLHSDSRSSGDTKTFTKVCDTNMFYLSLSLALSLYQKKETILRTKTVQAKQMMSYVY